jgi:glutamyl-tRNA reductase
LKPNVLSSITIPDVSLACGLAPLRVRSINHRTHGVSGLSSLAATPASAAAIHASLTGHGVASVVLVTCNRLELYWRSRGPQDDVVATGILASALGADAESMVCESAWSTGAAAARHLFRVCAGLESMVIGEAEVLGQARAALEASPGAGPFLTGVFRAAVRAGRAARAETAIGAGALSVASTAIQWLSSQMSLRDRRVLVVGAGDTARKAARHLNAVGVAALVIANRTRDHADAIAGPLGARAVGLETLPDELLAADAVIAAVDAPSWVITLAHLRERHALNSRPLVLIDLSMPPCIEPGEVGGLVRIGLGVLEHAALANRRRRETEAPRVEAVITREIEFLQRWARREAMRPPASRQVLEPSA